MQYNNKKIRLVQGLVFVWALLVLVCLGLPGLARAQDNALENLKETGKAFAAVARDASPAVVFIRVEKEVGSSPAMRLPFDDDFFRRFFGQPMPGQPMPGQPQAPQKQKRMVQGQGSGFIITPDGYILTNNHVVGEADKILVKLLDGREFTAKIIGIDPPTDVAVIKIDAKDLPILPLGDSDKLDVGEWVLALGNPFGLSHTLTAGIVSALGRSSIGISDYEDFIQTDAAINPGNSGGPLINLEGQAVGINTAIFSRSGGYMGIGFAIPVNMARNIYSQLIEHGNVTRGYLGVTIQELNDELAKSFGLKDTGGVLISQVMPDAPAEKAGLKQGDVVIRFNGEPVDSVAPFRNKVALTKPGTKVEITVLRDNKEKTFSVKIEKLTSEVNTAMSEPESIEKLGIGVTTLTKDLAQQHGYEGETGVVVTSVSPDSAAARSGIRPGILIKEVNRKQIKNVKDFEKAVSENGDKPILFLVKDERGTHYTAIRLDK
ncbi:MAG TPA: DegQ family serine endoprotease [Deltaproteobacteria bacterium]|nr:DegQ family serine endoprotease [Deltaproteobacteria bacterium]